MADVLSALSTYAWKGVAFPSSAFRVSIRHDLAQHRYPHRDGAHVEGMGRAPLQFSAKVPFYAGLQLGPNESNVKTPLYPDAFRDFIRVAVKGDTGDMVHPELGSISCKLESAECVWDATHRGGVDVDVVWVESTETDSELDTALGQPSPAQQVADAAQIADAELGAMVLRLQQSNATTDREVLARLREYQDQELRSASFSEIARRATALTDQLDVFQRRTTGAIESVVYRAQSLRSSIERAGTPKYWPLVQAMVRLESAGADLREQLGASSRALGLHPVRQDTTLAGVAQEIPASLGDVMKLNPALATSPIVAAGTTVRYFADAA